MLQEDMNYILKSHKNKKTTFHNFKNPELLERNRNRDTRNQLKSSNGTTADIYDQFYRDHQLLLKLFVILGVMPVVRSAPGIVTFSWKSYEMIYAFFLYIFTSSLVLRVGYERVKFIQTTEEFDEYIYGVIFVIFLVPHFWIPYVGWGVANQVAHYKTMWGSFQVRYYRVTGTTLTFPKLNFLIIVLFIGCVLLAVMFLYSLSRLLDGFLLWHTIAYFHIITMINMNAALFYINSRAIKRASHSLSACFKRDIKVECTSTLITQYRLLWLNLSEIFQTFGNAYARTYSTYLLFMSINIIIGAYGSLSEIFDSGFSFKVLGLIVLTIYCACLLFIVCDCANSATSVIAHGIQNTLLKVDLLRIDIHAQQEIDYFILAIELNPPVVSLQGYSVINRELISATISTIAIYLIVLLQFKLTIIAEQTYRSALTRTT
ncbi:gustatory and odorant receptor 22-like [Teleopsis dalmanni]|uniref:gustatory and odorant receptor 22-like n=1 Tax=Teleopsis dalmanni TaxID=139649 RepID=UPI0018CD606D|nr:gustatory and odorant receptor 22-like [Teleopsis dalmanni]XP_037930087.1 gustatory and odorant receptor 22-like [Teleopsis dalmanni]XP_037943228.1 gustatory and odorant receptor 22-like [Teleopsis dalmanni]